MINRETETRLPAQMVVLQPALAVKNLSQKKKKEKNPLWSLWCSFLTSQKSIEGEIKRKNK